MGDLKWHPAKENPPADGSYLTTIKEHFVPDHVWERDWRETIAIKYYSERHGWYLEDVIAWCELPTIYVPKSAKNRPMYPVDGENGGEFLCGRCLTKIAVSYQRCPYCGQKIRWRAGACAGGV